MASTPNCAIELESLSVDFQTVTVLDQVDCAVQRGEWVSIVGPSGCGKSTLLRCIAGLTRPTRGTVRLGCSNPAFVFQDATLLPWRTGFENIRLPLELTDTGPHSRDQAVQNVADLVGLSSADLQKFPRQLSGGMRMRVSLARALVIGPDALLLDEPFAAVDEILRQQLNQELLDIWQGHQITTLFVTHSVAEAVYLGQRVLVMNSAGSVIGEVEIDLPNERRAALRNTTEFHELTARISTMLQEGLR